jgi:anti-sigma B factor antagonist
MPAGWSISDLPVARTHETGVSTMGKVKGTGSGRVDPTVFAVEISSDAQGSRVTLSGELDLVSAPYLQQVLDQLCRQRPPDIVLDLSGLKFLSAAGLSVFLRADAHLRADGGRLILTRPGRLVRQMLAITELDTVLTIREEAARDLQPQHQRDRRTVLTSGHRPHQTPTMANQCAHHPPGTHPITTACPPR